MTADLRRITTWVFDLDETLYGRESGFLDAMEARIEDWLMRRSQGDAQAAQAERLTMRDQHGSTLAALVAAGDADVDAFLAHVQDIPLGELKPDVRLRRALQRLPGRRLIHTNAPGDHADRVLAALGIADQFEAVFHCHAAGFALKPQAEAFARMIARHLFDPAGAAFFEDRAANLKPAAALGMTTVLVGPDAHANTDPFVHHRTADLAAFLTHARLAETAA